MPIITIDGNIGCYKTSILNYFHKNYKLAIDLEPVDNWTDYLENLYNTPNSSYDFQIKVWIDRCWIQEKTTTSILMERSPNFIKNVFVRKAYEDKTRRPVRLLRQSASLDRLRLIEHLSCFHHRNYCVMCDAKIGKQL